MNAKEFPVNLACLMGQDLVEEVNNKKTLSGIFSGDEIILQDKEYLYTFHVGKEALPK